MNKQQPNKSLAGTNFAATSAQGQFGTEFASETNAQKVRQQNAQSANSSQAASQFGTEFASETNAAQVRQQNQQAEAHKSQNAGQFGNQS